ncbi:MAG: glycosyltransferase [Anaerolineae bacterium]|nr:glycosyltransferase [Anaerolineae bacterium]
MRIAVFNHRLLALGGGERLALNIAQALASAGHDVDFLHCDAITPDDVQQRLALSLDGIRLRRVLPLVDEVSAISREYDVFINSAHGQYVLPQAKRSAWVCFFPVGVDLSPSGRWRWRVGDKLRPLPAAFARRVSGAAGWLAQPRCDCGTAGVSRYLVDHDLHPTLGAALLAARQHGAVSAGRADTDVAQAEPHHQPGAFSRRAQQQEARCPSACLS